MGIDPDKVFKAIEPTWDNIESEFTRMTEIIGPCVEILGDNTGIGSRGRVGGIPWRVLKEIAFKLVD